MKEYLCIKDYYIEDVKFASKGDYVVLLPDNTTAVNKSGKQQVIHTPNILENKVYFTPTFKIKSTKESIKDVINCPAHYTQGNIECIEAMISAFGKEKVMTFCQCNAFKYIWRFDKKNGIEDIKKAEWYLNKYKELQNGNDL